MMLRGMGFQNDTPIFLAAGKIFKAEKYMIPLRQMFPFLQTKETLLSREELEPFKVRFLSIFRNFPVNYIFFYPILYINQGLASQSGSLSGQLIRIFLIVHM